MNRGSRIKAAGLFLFFAVTGSLVRLARADFGILPALAPLDFHGTSTNFAVCAGTPFLAVCFKQVHRFADYMKVALTTAVGLSVYEVVQLYLPQRTFDPWDIAVSFFGAIASILVARLLVF